MNITFYVLAQKGDVKNYFRTYKNRMSFEGVLTTDLTKARVFTELSTAKTQLRAFQKYAGQGLGPEPVIMELSVTGVKQHDIKQAPQPSRYPKKDIKVQTFGRSRKFYIGYIDWDENLSRYKRVIYNETVTNKRDFIDQAVQMVNSGDYPDHNSSLKSVISGEFKFSLFYKNPYHG